MQTNVKTRLKNIDKRLGNKAKSDKLCLGFAYKNLKDGKLYDESGKPWVRPEYGKDCERFLILDCPIEDISEIPAYNAKLGRSLTSNVQIRQN